MKHIYHSASSQGKEELQVRFVTYSLMHAIILGCDPQLCWHFLAEEDCSTIPSLTFVPDPIDTPGSTQEMTGLGLLRHCSIWERFIPLLYLANGMNE